MERDVGKWIVPRLRFPHPVTAGHIRVNRLTAFIRGERVIDQFHIAEFSQKQAQPCRLRRHIEQGEFS